MVVAAVLVVVTTTGSRSSPAADASGGAATGQRPSAASAAYVAAITTIPASVFDTVGTDALGVPLTVTRNQPPLTSNRLPLLLYVGTEYCPYCAMLRYSLVAALARFGTFRGLKQTSSGRSDGDVPTFSFLGARYQSRYVAFAPYETLDRQEPNPQPLEKLPGWAGKLYAIYDGSASGAPARPFNAGGSAGIPFVDLANRYLSVGAPAPFASLWVPGGPLRNGGPGRLRVAAGIRDPGSSTGRYIHGELFIAQANYLTAAICAVDGGRPGVVCGSRGVVSAAKRLAAAPRVG